MIQAPIEKRRDFKDKIQDAQRYILEVTRPKTFYGPNGLEVVIIKDFEDACFAIAQSGVHNDPKNMSTLSFYRAIHHIKKQAKKEM